VGGYVRQFDITVTHDGEPITVTLKPAKFGDVAKLQSAGDSQADLVKGFQTLLADYIIDMKGPMDAAGTQVPKDEFLSAAYFLQPVLEIGTGWVQRAMPQNPPLPGA